MLVFDLLVYIIILFLSGFFIVICGNIID